MEKKNVFKFLMRIGLVAVLMFSLAENIHAQDVDPRNGTVKHNDGKRPCLVINLDPEPKPLKNAWKSFLKDKYDFKIKGIGFLINKDLLYAEDVVIQEISSKRMNFYTKIVEDEVGSEMKVFASFGYDIYINEKETPKEYKVIRKMLNDFLKYYLPKYYNSEVKATKKKVKKLSKDVKRLNKDISNNKNEIENLSEEIEELTKEVSEKESQLEMTNIKLIEREEKLKRINSKFSNSK